MVTLVKFGGSLITNKLERSTLRPDVLERLAREVRVVLDTQADLRLIIGHGSGSFGHFEAKEYGTIQGVTSGEGWLGFSRVATIAAELNYHVACALMNENIPVLRVQPSASVIARSGFIRDMATYPIIQALENGLVPLVYGDVAFDEALGGTIISTETVFRYLVSKLPVKRILLMGEVDGVYDENNKVIPHITPDNFDAFRSALGGSDGVDVTGGMLTKVQDMLQLATQAPYPDVFILNGLVEGRLIKALAGEDVIGTGITN